MTSRAAPGSGERLGGDRIICLPTKGQATTEAQARFAEVRINAGVELASREAITV